MGYQAPGRIHTHESAQLMKDLAPAVFTLRDVCWHEGQGCGHKSPDISTDITEVCLAAGIQL